MWWTRLLWARSATPLWLLLLEPRGWRSTWWGASSLWAEAWVLLLLPGSLGWRPLLLLLLPRPRLMLLHWRSLHSPLAGRPTTTTAGWPKHHTPTTRWGRHGWRHHPRMEWRLLLLLLHATHEVWWGHWRHLLLLLLLGPSRWGSRARHRSGCTPCRDAVRRTHNTRGSGGHAWRSRCCRCRCAGCCCDHCLGGIC